MMCLQNLENFHDFRDMCRESENLLNNYISGVEKCTRNRHHNEASDDSPSKTQEPVPNLVTVKTEPEEIYLNVPPHQETVGNACQSEQLIVVKSEPKEEQMNIDASDTDDDSSSQQFFQTGAGLEKSADFGASGDSVQDGGSGFSDSDSDIAEKPSEETKETELTIESEGPAAEEERYSLQHSIVGRTIHQESRQVDEQSHRGGIPPLPVITLYQYVPLETKIQSQYLEKSASMDTTVNGGVMHLKLVGKERDSLNSSICRLDLVCPECNKVFDHRCKLDIHMRVHTGEKPYVCPTCNKAFKHKASLTNHSRIHSGEKPYSCSVCHKQFRQTSTLRKHMQFHAKKPYSCNLCTRAFGIERDLRRHSVLRHT